MFPEHLCHAMQGAMLQLLPFRCFSLIKHGQNGQNVCNGVQSNRMDTNEEYVEEYDDDVDYEDSPARKAAAKQPPKLKRYKDDAYRCAVYATGLLSCCCAMQCHNIALIWLPE